MCVQVRFTRAFKGLIFPPSEPPGEIMSFGVSPVNYSDSDSDSDSLLLSVKSRIPMAITKITLLPVILGLLLTSSFLGFDVGEDIFKVMVESLFSVIIG